MTKCDQPDLTPREASVAVGIATSKTYQEISEELGLIFETVRSIVDRLRDKTGRRRKSELAIWASSQLPWLLSRMQKP